MYKRQVLGVISVLLTGGIGLLEIDSKWLAVKEAAIPAVIGIGVLVASKLGFPLVRKFLFNPAILNTEKIDEELLKKGNTEKFETRLDRANYFFAGTFGFSAVMNFLLAKWIVKSDTGTTAFNEELGAYDPAELSGYCNPFNADDVCNLFLYMENGQ